MTRTSGTATNGVWTGSHTIPIEFPTNSQYSIFVFIRDNARNTATYGAFGNLEMPGGDVIVNVLGGGPYWEWAYSTIESESPLVGMSQDPNGDGLNNLTCFAFGLDPVFEATFAELPEITITPAGNLRIDYWRRVGVSGVTYTPQFSDNLVSWTDFTGSQIIPDSDDEWDYYSSIDTQTTTTSPKRFGRVKLTYVDP